MWDVIFAIVVLLPVPCSVVLFYELEERGLLRPSGTINSLSELWTTKSRHPHPLEKKVRIEAWDESGLERLIRYCARPPFKSENIRLNGPWIHYRLPKQCHTGKTFIQLEPIDFIERISRFIPYPHRHRRHYHGIFAPNSSHRKHLVANAKKRLDTKAKAMQQTVEKVTKATRSWAQLIARIYEIDPLICLNCGKKIKILAFITHREDIRRILRGIGWSIEMPKLDPSIEPYEPAFNNICQLVPGTHDGFPEPEVQVHYDSDDPGPDPPHWEDHSDPPHWED